MKKILLILVLCLSTIGLAGCGNKLPDKVELTPENNYTATVGADIKEGKKYYVKIEGDLKVFENAERTKNVFILHISGDDQPFNITEKQAALGEEILIEAKIEDKTSIKLLSDSPSDKKYLESVKVYIISE